MKNKIIFDALYTIFLLQKKHFLGFPIQRFTLFYDLVRNLRYTTSSANIGNALTWFWFWFWFIFDLDNCLFQLSGKSVLGLISPI